MSCYNAGHASKIYNLNNLPEPKNATEAFHSKPYSFSIPENIDDFNKSNDQNNNTSKSNSIFKGNSKALSKVLQKLNIGPSNTKTSTNVIILLDNQNYHERNIINQQVKNQDVDDNDEICNNPNLHPEEQEEFEIPNGLFKTLGI
ncbi:hypothetical protein RhiirA1_521054 [Rhizophagus irregularis]|uniref:Uncharacterized protein n=1 Tax=Rhizophagus irregularis TaxID=588596 RepID=A0A2N0RHI3_9GLOM|nr:hypothetical protein RhiirA1_521054 [Rhizophagus irregularis]